MIKFQALGLILLLIIQNNEENKNFKTCTKVKVELINGKIINGCSKIRNNIREKSTLKIKTNKGKVKVKVHNIKKIEVLNKKIRIFNDSIKITLKPIYIKKRKQPRLMYLVQTGNLNHFIDVITEDLSGRSGGITPEGFDYIYRIHYVKTKNETFAHKIYTSYNPLTRSYALDYFKDNKLIYEKINKLGQKINDYKIYNIITYFNNLKDEKIIDLNKE